MSSSHGTPRVDLPKRDVERYYAVAIEMADSWLSLWFELRQARAIIADQYRNLLDRPIVVSLATLMSDGAPQVQPVGSAQRRR